MARFDHERLQGLLLGHFHRSYSALVLLQRPDAGRQTPVAHSTLGFGRHRLWCWAVLHGQGIEMPRIMTPPEHHSL